MKKFFNNKYTPTYLVIDETKGKEYYYSFFENELDEIGRQLKYSIYERDFDGYDKNPTLDIYYVEITFSEYQNALSDNLLVHLENLTKN